MTDALDAARTALTELDESLANAFDSDQYGFPWYASIGDAKIQVVRSNQVIGLVDAAASHLDALAESARQVRELVGPNGRTMPRPDESEALAEHERIWIEITDGLRAAGSLLDVLGGLTVLWLGLPVSPTFADSRQLLTCLPDPPAASEAQTQAIERARTVVAASRDSGPTGWLEWTVESRNAMVHRGRTIASFRPVPAAGHGRRMVVVSGMPPQRVLRFFPHLRRLPDLMDAETVLMGASLDQIYLNEPAQDTLDGLRERCAALTQTVVGNLHTTVDDLADFMWPATQWALPARTARAELAEAFVGFDPPAQAPDMDAIVMHPRTAERLIAAENIRAAEQGDGRVEPGATADQ